MKFFVYCRKSTDREDKQILSTEAQQRLLTQYAERHQIIIVGVYVENQSAYKAGRPMFNEMLRRIEAGEADAILTYHLTRLARNSYDGGRIIYMMDERSIVQIATPEKSYLNNADDKFMMQIHFAMAKKSSDDTSEFVRRDVESKLLRGECPGKVPIGYLNINRDGHIVRGQDDPDKYMRLLQLSRPLRREEIDPIDGPIVRKFFEEAAKGTLSMPRLRHLSYKMGIRARKSGKMLTKNAVEDMLTNPYYYGVIRYTGRIYDTAYIREKGGNPRAAIQHDPLISKALFDRVQDALYGRSKGAYRRHRFSFGACLLLCGECGSPVTAERQKGHVYYHCTRNRGPCSQKAWAREEELEAQLEGVLQNLRIPQAYLDYSFERLRIVHAEQAKSGQAMRIKMQNLLNVEQQKLDGLLQLKISPGNVDGSLLDDEEYLRQKTAIRREIDLLHEQLVTLQQQGENWVDDCERFFAFTQGLAGRFSVGDVELKKTLLNIICSNLTLKDRKVAWVYRDPYATLAEFPLAGRDEKQPFEPELALAGAEKSDFSDKWLHLLTVIRTSKFTVYPFVLP